jgi:hypothetical protein
LLPNNPDDTPLNIDEEVLANSGFFTSTYFVCTVGVYPKRLFYSGYLESFLGEEF